MADIPRTTRPGAEPFLLPSAPGGPPAEWSATWHPPLTDAAWLRFYGPQATAVTTPEPASALAFATALAALALRRWARSWGSRHG